MRVTPHQKGLIESVLAFANLKTVESLDQVVVTLIDRAYHAAELRIRIQEMNTPLVALRAVHERLRADLRTIATQEGGHQKALDDVGKGVVRRLTEAGPTVTFEWQRGRMMQRINLDRYDVDAYCSLALVLILDDGLGLTSRLGCCRYSRCGRFRLDFNPTGRPRVFCAGHKERYDNEQSNDRVKKWRANQKRRGTKHGTQRPKG